MIGCACAYGAGLVLVMFAFVTLNYPQHCTSMHYLRFIVPLSAHILDLDFECVGYRRAIPDMVFLYGGMCRGGLV